MTNFGCDTQPPPHPVRPLLRESQVLLCPEFGRSVDHRLQTDVRVGYIQSPMLYTNLHNHGHTVDTVMPEGRNPTLLAVFRATSLTTPGWATIMLNGIGHATANGDLCRITS